MKTKMFGSTFAIVACAMLTPAYAGGSHGHHGSSPMNVNQNWNHSEAWSKSSSSVNNSITFKNSNGGANYLFGAAAIIGAFNPPEGQKIIVRGGNVNVQVNFVNGGAPGLPPLKDTYAPHGGTDHRPICEDGQPYKPNCRVR